MNEFKVGDWVCHGRDTHQIIEVNEEFKVRASRLGMLSDAWICPSKFTLWQPKEGEWCWFNNNLHLKKEFPRLTLLKYSDIFEADKFQGNFEPFIGELPSFLKDKR